MIRELQTSNFRMLPGNRVTLDAFHVLVGQNATGKSTFLGALQFVADVLSLGAKGAVERAVGSRGSFHDLCFDPTKPIQFAVEVEFPRAGVETKRLRYEIEIGISREGEGLRVLRECLFVLPATQTAVPFQTSLFGEMDVPAVTEKVPRTWRKVVEKKLEGKDYFRDEKTEWNNVFKFGTDRAALGSIPEDPERFPLSIAVRDLLRDGVRTIALDAAKLRASSAPGGSAKIALDGSNLPYVVRDLQQRDPVLFSQWVEHVATGVSGLVGVQVDERPEDRHLVLKATFSGRHETPVPSWLLSDGTLRLMAITLLTFAATPDSQAVYLIEEPENGLHPLAMQTVFDALSSPTGNVQLLCATHSPIFLAQVRLDQALVFKRHPQGWAVVRRGDEVPELASWGARKNLADLFVTGVLS
jgi:predicted ATPase